MTREQPAFAAVDWGTSRFRLWLMDEAGGVLDQRQSEDGMLRTQREAFSGVLEAHLSALGGAGDLPVVVCGMAGARQGWLEVAYVDVPASPADIAAGCQAPADAVRTVRIVPGLAVRGASPNVMRGEETQLLGLVLAGTTDGLVAMPGTHSKWVVLDGGQVVDFTTFLTGELYALMSSQSILMHAVGPDAGQFAVDHPAFVDGVRTGLADPARLTAEFFTIRAMSLLDGLASDAAAARLSGLLIGTEVAAARSWSGSERKDVTLIASGRMEALYRAAIGLAAMGYTVADADRLARSGLLVVARALWPDRVAAPARG